MKLEVGEYYMTANGQIVLISEYDEDYFYPYRLAQGGGYYENGNYAEKQDHNDIIAHIPKALAFEIARITEAYHTSSSFKGIIENCYHNHLNKD